MLSAQPAPWPLAVPSTSDNPNDRGTPSPTSVQTEKNGVKGVDYKITFKNANRRRYQELVNEFNSVMEDVVNEALGDTDPIDRVRFAILSSNFDRALNTMYQPRSEVTGVALAEFFGKMLQSNQSIDINLILHVQRVNLPRGNGTTKRKLAVNMGLNILLKRCVFTAARQYDDIHCFGYALALAIMLKDHNANYVQRRFSIYKQKVLDRVHDIFNIANIPYGPVDFAQYPQFVPLLPQNCRLIVVDAKERGTSLFCCIKAKWLTLLTMSQCMMYVCCCTDNTTTLLTRCRRGLGGRTIVWNAKKHTTTTIGTSVNQITLVTCVMKRLACTSHPTQDSVNNVLVYFATVSVSRITDKTRYAHAQHRVKSVVTGFPDRSPITFANHSIALTVTRR